MSQQPGKSPSHLRPLHEPRGGQGQLVRANMRSINELVRCIRWATYNDAEWNDQWSAEELLKLWRFQASHATDLQDDDFTVELIMEALR